MWVRAGVSLITENAFPRIPFEARLRKLADLSRMRVIVRQTSDDVAFGRYATRELADPLARPDRRALTLDKMESGTYRWRAFESFDLGIPSLSVDTTDGYQPSFEDILAFCRQD